MTDRRGNRLVKAALVLVAIVLTGLMWSGIPVRTLFEAIGL
jgi:hypothetical protein